MIILEPLTVGLRQQSFKSSPGGTTRQLGLRAEGVLGTSANVKSFQSKENSV